MSDAAFVEVPAPRRARAVRIGMMQRYIGTGVWGLLLLPHVDINPGDELACRARDGEFRHGIARVAPDGHSINFDVIVGLCDGDIVYRVEPQ